MKTLKIIYFLLFFFTILSCGGGRDGDFITIDLNQQTDNKKSDAPQNDDKNKGEDNNEDGKDKDGGNEENRNEENRNEENGNEENGNEENGNEENGNNTSSNDSNPIMPNENINSSKAYLYVDLVSRGIIVHQSAACYGDYAFFFSSKMVNIMVFNMRTNTNIFTLKKQKALGSDNVYHCNQACFGTQKYSKEDPFPLLYISQFQNKDNRCFITVFRILPTSGDIDQGYTAFAFERIQTIYFPVATDNNSLNNVNAVIDTDNHFIYTYSRNNNADAENYKRCKISKFSIPDPLELSSVYLSDSDILDSYFIPTEASNMQGGAYQKGLLYIGRGAPKYGYVYLYVIDLANRKLWYTVDLYNNGYNAEPEGSFFYNDNLHIGAGTAIYRFTFKYENSSAKAVPIPVDMPE